MIEDSLAQEAGVPWAAPRLRFDDVKGDLQSVVEGDQWTRGMYTRILEDRLGDAVGRYCVLTSSGTSALMASLFHAADRGGRRVAVPDFGYHAAARAAALSGSTLHLLDSSADTPTIDAAAALSLNAPITVGMHYMDILFSSSLGDLRTKKRLLIEDSAASLLVQDRDRRAGTLGDMSVISLHASKPIAAGEGGAIFVDDRQEADALRRIVQRNGLIESTTYKVGSSQSLNANISELNAVLGAASLARAQRHLPDLVSLRKDFISALGAVLDESFPATTVLRSTDADFGPVSLLMENESQRDHVLRTLRSRGIQARAMWLYAAHDDPAIRAAVEGPIATFPRADDWRRRLLNLPFHWGFTSQHSRTILEAFESMSTETPSRMLRMHLLRLLFRSSHVRFRSPTGTARFAPLKAAQLRESAYVIAFTADGSHVLLAPRDDGAGLEIPGGGRDARESIRDAALRETFEETGVTIAGELRKLLVHLDWFFDESDGRMYVSKQHFFIASLPPRTPVSDQSLLTETSSAGDHLNPNDADVIALAFQKRL